MIFIYNRFITVLHEHFDTPLSSLQGEQYRVESTRFKVQMENDILLRFIVIGNIYHK